MILPASNEDEYPLMEEWEHDIIPDEVVYGVKNEFGWWLCVCEDEFGHEYVVLSGGGGITWPFDHKEQRERFARAIFPEGFTDD